MTDKGTLRESLSAGVAGLLDVLVDRICNLEAMLLSNTEVGSRAASS